MARVQTMKKKFKSIAVAFLFISLFFLMQGTKGAYSQQINFSGVKMNNNPLKKGLDVTLEITGMFYQFTTADEPEQAGGCL